MRGKGMDGRGAFEPGWQVAELLRLHFLYRGLASYLPFLPSMSFKKNLEKMSNVQGIS